MREAKVKILSTKVLNNELLEEVTRNGYSIKCAPFIDIQLLSNANLKNELKKIVGLKSKSLIFTSINGVNSWVNNVGKITGENTNIFCVSGRTKDACSKLKGMVTIIHKINSEKLADAIIQQKTSLKNLFFITGNKHSQIIPDKLKQAGISFSKVIVYENSPLQTKIDFKPDAILFFSPSAVESYFSQNRIFNNTIYFAIGKTTAKAIKKLTYRTPITPDFPSQEEMIKKIYEHFQSSKSYT
jgi:uroporphyrinogen-III synthase